jgi:hypothetical protein
MRVKMNVQITGNRNGAYWPAPGGEIDLPDVEGAKMCAAGYASPVQVEVETATPRAVETATRKTTRKG